MKARPLLSNNVIVTSFAAADANPGTAGRTGAAAAPEDLPGAGRAAQRRATAVHASAKRDQRLQIGLQAVSI